MFIENICQNIEASAKTDIAIFDDFCQFRIQLM